MFTVFKKSEWGEKKDENTSATDSEYEFMCVYLQFYCIYKHKQLSSWLATVSA